MSTPDQDYPVWFYVDGGVTQGPVSVLVIRSLVASGHLGPNDPVRHVGWNNWWPVYEAATTLGVAVPQSAPAQAAPVQAAPGQPMPAQAGPMQQTQAQPAPAQATHAQPTPAQPTPAQSTPVQAATPYVPTGATAGAPNMAAPTSYTPYIGPVPAAASFYRLLAWVIDLGVLVMILIASNFVFEYTPLACLVTVAMTMVYLVVLPAAGFIRAGHLIAGLRIVDADTMDRPNPQAVAARGLVLMVLALPMLVGAIGSVLNVFLSVRRVAWHDAVTSTLVIKKR